MNQDNRFDPPQAFAQQGNGTPQGNGPAQGNMAPQATGTAQFDPNSPPGYAPTGQPVFGPPQTPAPKKNWFARHKFLTVIGAIILIIIFANSFGGGPDAPSTATKPAATAEAEKAPVAEQEESAPQEQASAEPAAAEEPGAEPVEEDAGGYRIGDVAMVGDMSYRVISAQTATEVGPSFALTKAKGTFLVLKIEVTNNANESALVDSSFFALKSGEKKYDADSTASLWANTQEDGGNNSFFLESLNPDLTMDGIVVFDVSESVATAVDNVLVAQTGFWGTETVDILLTD